MSGEPATIDLHGRRPEDAMRFLSQGLHAERMRGAKEVLVVTGRGMGNRKQEPVLRTRVESWLRGGEGKRHGCKSFERVAQGGALLVRLA